MWSSIHECSICGSEFSSGQALGGHMGRNRSTPVNPRISSTIEYHEQGDKTTIRNILQLDLNLPAPEDDLRDLKFQFTPNHQQHLVFSAALVLVDSNSWLPFIHEK
uniref:C2H2-type domain-containing protein n=2 Tax=Davidia involucrata TaxID=16924 RepID=A0A5B6YZ56_DAVIN